MVEVRVGAAAQRVSPGGARPRAREAAERLDYGASEGRRTVFALLFLVLAPFVVSLPVMLYHRIDNGQWSDLAQTALIALVLAAIMAMVVLELLYSLRARLTLDRTALRFTLPVGLGPTPLFAYQSHHIPYHTIKGVELRREVFGAPLMPVLMQGAVVHTKDKGSIALGYASEAKEGGAFPFAEIAGSIARRAAVPLIEQRTIWRRPRKERALGYISEIDTQNYIVDPAEMERLHVAHRRHVLALLSGLATLLLLGIGTDLMSGG